MPTKTHHSLIPLLATLGDILPGRWAEPLRPSSICQITSGYCGYERLLAPEGEAGGAGGGGGGDKTFTQAELDRIVQERVAKQNEKIKALEAGTARLAEIEKKLADADEREKKALEDAELKGKTELEKLQIQVQKANDSLKTRDADWQKKYGEIEALKSQAEARFTEYVKTGAIKDALRSAGLAKGADKAAALAFMTEAQIELAEDGQSIQRLTVGGKSFDKPQEAAKHFISENPFFAEVPQGGSNSPRGSNGAGAPQALEQHHSAESLIGAGLSQRAAST
jgi:hypothetical protein